MTEPRPSAPDTQSPLAPLPTHEAREHVVAQLSSHFSEDRLTLAELERRVHIAYATPSTAELHQLLADLVAPDPVDGTLATFPARGRIQTVLSSTERGGPIFVPRKLEVRNVLGSTELDLSRATFAPGVTEIDIHVVLGSVEIALPPHVQVASEGSGILGSFVLHSGPIAGAAPQSIVRITGKAVLGSVETWPHGRTK